MTEEKEIVDLVAKLYRTFKKVGVQRVVSALDVLCRKNIDNYESKVISFIKLKACEAYGVNEDDMNRSVIMYDAFDCRDLIIVLTKKHLDIKHLQLSALFGKKGHSLVSRALNDFKNKNEKIKEHKIYLENYAKINPEIDNYKQTIK